MSEPDASGPVYIFIDYSNVVHEGSRELSITSDKFNVDLNRLVLTVCNGRKLGGVFIAGSTPQTAPTPPKDELSWKRAEDLGYNVKTFPRNASNKEKGVDVHLACNMMEIILTKTPGILVLVTGDSDFSTPIKKAQLHNWGVEIWFWPRGMANNFKKLPHVSLKHHFKSFVYVTKTFRPESKYILKISGNIIKNWKWRNEPIMEYFFTCNLLCQFYWINDTTAHLYFDNKNQLKEASDWWLSKQYPNMLVEESGKDIKSDKPKDKKLSKQYPNMLVEESGKDIKSDKPKDKKFSEIVVDLPHQTAEDQLVNLFYNGGPLE